MFSFDLYYDARKHKIKIYPQNVDYFNNFGSMITNDTVKIQDFHGKATFDKKKTLFTNRLD